MRTLIAALAVAMSTTCLAEGIGETLGRYVTQIELYDVSDLTTVAQDSSTTGKATSGGIDMVEVVQTALPDIAWGGESVYVRGDLHGMLEVRGSDEVQKRVEGVLAAMRANRGTMIQVDTKVIEFDLSHGADLLRYAGISVSRQGMFTEHVRAITSALQMQIFLAHVGHESHDGWLISSPRLTLFHGQQASMTIAQQEAYVRDYEEIHREGCVIADPVLSMFTDGLFLDLRVLRLAEGTLRVAGMARTSSLLAMEELPMTLSNGVQVTIDMPHITTEMIRFNVEIQEGESLLLLGGPRKDGKAAMWLITPSVVPTGPAPR